MGSHSVICHPTEVTAPPNRSVFDRSVETRTSGAADWQVRNEITTASNAARAHGTCLPCGQLPRDKTPIYLSIYLSIYQTTRDDAVGDCIRR